MSAQGLVRYRGEPREISRKYRDIYLCGDEYRIGDPINGTPVHSETKHGKILAYLLEHIGEKVSYEKLAEVSGSKDPRGAMTAVKCSMRSSKHFRFVRRPTSAGDCVKLEERL